jgi:lipoprotein-anchoring transpeptidase ErfK/SrfK
MIGRCAALAVAACVLVGTPALAQDARWGIWGEESQVKKKPVTTSLFAPQGKTKKKKKGAAVAGMLDQDFDADEQQVKRAVALASGGPRPSIAARSPKTVAFSGYAPGSVIVDTAGRRLYYVKGGGTAYVYPITVGKQGFTWTGTQKVSRIANWPDWTPPAEMRQRKPHLPLKMTGGLYNPLGAKAIYLGSTLYRIHGTNDAGSIGQAASSGCFRMHNGHVVHLARLVRPGTTVHVLRGVGRNVASAKKPGSAG